jgi:pimeloyl-ACP methyl ester carboxylesterase
MWRDFPARLAHATGCRTLVYSRYGYGQSDLLEAPFGTDYMHREGRETLPELLAALEIENPVLVGHSDGASIALLHAGAGHPVAGVVVMAPHCFVEDISIRSIAAAKVAFETTDLPAKLGKYHRDVDRTFWGWNDIWLHPDFRAWNIEDCLPNIRCPILAIQGEDDEYGTMAQIEAIAAGARNSAGRRTAQARRLPAFGAQGSDRGGDRGDQPIRREPRFAVPPAPTSSRPGSQVPGHHGR